MDVSSINQTGFSVNSIRSQSKSSGYLAPSTEQTAQADAPSASVSIDVNHALIETPDPQQLKARFDQQDAYMTWMAKAADYASKRQGIAKARLGLGDDAMLAMDSGGAAVLDRMAAAQGLVAPPLPDSLKGTRFDTEADSQDSSSATGMIGVTYRNADSSPLQELLSGNHFEIAFDRRSEGDGNERLEALAGNDALKAQTGRSRLASLSKDASYAITSPTGEVQALVSSAGMNDDRASVILGLFRTLKAYF